MSLHPVTPTRPADFRAFWHGVDQDLERWPGRAVLEPLPVRSGDEYAVYGLRITGIGPYRLFGYFSVPAGEGPFPALYEVPRHGSVNHVPDHNDRVRYVVLTLMHRGQRLADRPFVAPYPGLLTLGIETPATYIYRDIVADCLRGAEFLLHRPEVDPKRVAVAGDDLALLTAARRSGFGVVRYGGPLLYRALEARRMTSAYPLEELNDLLRLRPELAPAVAHTLAYFDPWLHAPDVQGETIAILAGGRGPGGEPFLDPLLQALGGPVDRYRQTFEGGTDHDVVDAMLAHRLDVRPMSRFISQVVPA